MSFPVVRLVLILFLVLFAITLIASVVSHGV